MNYRDSIWVYFFAAVACVAFARHSELLLQPQLQPMSMPLSKLAAKALPSSGTIAPPPVDSEDLVSEPSVTSNSKGATHWAVARVDTYGNSRGGLDVWTSRDGSRWDIHTRVFHNNQSGAASSPSITCDTAEMIDGRKNPNRNRIYLAWVLSSTPDSSSDFSQILFSVSVNGGVSFILPVNGELRIIPLRLNIGSSSVSNPVVTVGDEGEIVVSWTETNPDGSTTLVSRISNNGGVSFGPVRK